jgi:hypothetical protein
VYRAEGNSLLLMMIKHMLGDTIRGACRLPDKPSEAACILMAGMSMFRSLRMSVPLGNADGSLGVQCFESELVLALADSCCHS